MLDTVRRGADRASRLARAAAVSGGSGKVYPADLATQLLEAIIEPGDRVTIEGDNQKQADFLASALAKVDAARLHDLHMVQSVLALPRGMRESFGIMVNYLYDRDTIEDNQKAFPRGTIVHSQEIDALL